MIDQIAPSTLTRPVNRCASSSTGSPCPDGATMLARREWAGSIDHLRRSIMLEPRGHADMYGALLTEPVTPRAHAGVLFMHNEGWSTMCGPWRDCRDDNRHRAWPDVGRHRRTGDTVTMVLDVPAGPVTARATTVQVDGRTRVSEVAFRNPPRSCWRPACRCRSAAAVHCRRVVRGRLLRHRRRRSAGCRSTSPGCRTCAAPAWRSHATWSGW